MDKSWRASGQDSSRVVPADESALPLAIAPRLPQASLPASTPVFPAEALIVAIVNRISEQEYRELALNESDRLWELWDGELREKPLMSMKHEDVASYLGAALITQLDRRLYRVNINGGRARVSPRSYYIPNVVAIPAAYKLPFEDDPRAFNAFAESLPLVVEIWSPSTGHYDVATKLQGYRERGDAEIWFIQPYERTLTASRRQPDGSYTEDNFRGGLVSVASLPGVIIDFDALLNG
jgi:Uma2 family endonuclease